MSILRGVPLLLLASGCAGAAAVAPKSAPPKKKTPSKKKPPTEGSQGFAIDMGLLRDLNEAEQKVANTSLPILGQRPCEGEDTEFCRTNHELTKAWNDLVKEVPNAGIPLLLKTLETAQKIKEDGKFLLDEEILGKVYENHEELIFTFLALNNELPLPPRSLLHIIIDYGKMDRGLFFHGAWKALSRHWEKTGECFEPNQFEGFFKKMPEAFTPFALAGLQGGNCTPEQIEGLLIHPQLFDYRYREAAGALVDELFRQEKNWPNSAVFRVQLIAATAQADSHSKLAKAGIFKIWNDFGDESPKWGESTQDNYWLLIASFRWLLNDLPEKDRLQFALSHADKKPNHALLLLEVAKDFANATEIPLLEDRQQILQNLDADSSQKKMIDDYILKMRRRH